MKLFSLFLILILNQIVVEGQTCNPGYYQDQNGSSGCTQCPIGQYQPQSAQPACIYCPVGKYNNNVGQTECVFFDVNSCPTNFIKTGQDDCELCSIPCIPDTCDNVRTAYNLECLCHDNTCIDRKFCKDMEKKYQDDCVLKCI